MSAGWVRKDLKVPKALSQWMPENAKLRRGRCLTRWERDAKLAGMDQDLESMAVDKAQWRDMLSLLVPLTHVAVMTMMIFSHNKLSNTDPLMGSNYRCNLQTNVLVSDVCEFAELQDPSSSRIP